jgi:FkbM family methyltransferase
LRTAVGQVNTLRSLKRWKRHLDRLGVGDLALVKGIASRIKQRYLQPRDGSSDAIHVDLHGLHYAIPQRFVEHYLLQEYEPVTSWAFLGSLREGMVVIDVGAHIGYYTLLAARTVGQAGRVHAVEPSRENQEFLAENIRLNGMENVTLHSCAAGKSQGNRVFHLTGSSDSHGFYPHPCTETVQTIEINVRPLDEIVQGSVDAIKIDVEGAEIEVLQGMSRVLAESPQISLCVEWNLPCLRNAGYDPCELPVCLQDLGFREIEVLDDVEQRRRSLEEVLALVRSRQVPEIWYVNLWARRA